MFMGIGDNLDFNFSLKPMGKSPPKKRRKPKKKANLTTKKKIMDIGIHSKFVTYSGKYGVHWGERGNAKQYNKQGRYFTKRKDAVKFKNQLIRKHKKMGYKIDYMYLAD